MIAHSPSGSPNFKRVAKGLIELHRLDRQGKDDSPEAESIRDALDAPLDALDPVERERAQWLSEDLYSVSDPPESTPPREMNPQAQQKFNEVAEARQNGEWDRALTLLRCWKGHFAPALLSSLRGTIWLESGYPDVAAIFYGHASETDPNNFDYRGLYLRALANSDPDAAGNLALDVLDNGQNRS